MAGEYKQLDTDEQQHTIEQKDGVFANLSAKPQASTSDDAQTTPQKEELPTYDSAAEDAAPPYHIVQVINNRLYGDNEEYYDLGTPYMFMVTAMCTIAFQLIGFLVCFLFSRSLAGKSGARFGFGFVMLQLGLQSINNSTPDEVYISYFLGALGFFLMTGAAYQYAAARRIYLKSTSEAPVSNVMVADDVV